MSVSIIAAVLIALIIHDLLLFALWYWWTYRKCGKCKKKDKNGSKSPKEKEIIEL